MSETILQRQTLQAGDRIFKESEKGQLAYIVQSGEVEIFKVIDGIKTVLGRIAQGGIFGEMALINFQPRMADARASKGSTIIVVNRTTFEQKMKKADPFNRGLLNILVNHIRSKTK